MGDCNSMTEIHFFILVSEDRFEGGGWRCGKVKDLLIHTSWRLVKDVYIRVKYMMICFPNLVLESWTKLTKHLISGHRSCEITT